MGFKIIKTIFFHLLKHLKNRYAGQNKRKKFIVDGALMKKIKASLLIILVFLCLLGAAGCHPRADAPGKAGESPGKDTNTQTAEQSPADENPSLQPQNTASPGDKPIEESAAQKEKACAVETDFKKLAPTVSMSFAELVGDNGDYSKVKSYPTAGTYQLEVNLYYQVITAYTKDANGKYTVPARYMICSTGRSTDPTPAGTFKMGSQRFRFSKFETYNVYGQYWSQITRNIFFHSLLYTQKNAKTYTASSYKSLGKRVSHGCIRMLVPDARWIYYYAAPGTVVKIIKGKKDAAMDKIKKKLTRPKLPSKRPNLKKGKIPVTEPWPGY